MRARIEITLSRAEADRFWSKVELTTTCWYWTGAPNADGYGRYCPAGHPAILAHRVAYRLAFGMIPNDQEIDHLCRNRRCVHPAHLEAVDHRTNVLRGIGLSAQAARQPVCSRGHKFDEENTAYRGNARICRICRTIRSLSRHHRGIAHTAGLEPLP